MCNYKPGESWKQEEGFSCEPLFYKVYDKVDKKVADVKAINYVDRTVQTENGWRRWEEVIFLEYSGYLDKDGNRIFYGDYIISARSNWRFPNRVFARGSRTWLDGIFWLCRYEKWEIKKTGRNMFDNFGTEEFRRERIEEEEED